MLNTIELPLKQLNEHFTTLCRPFAVDQDKEIQDFNYEVDALEDEHVRRDVVTTKVMQGAMGAA